MTKGEPHYGWDGDTFSVHLEQPGGELSEEQVDAMESVLSGETREAWEARRASGAFLCGPRAPTAGDLAVVEQFKAFLECMTCTQRAKCALNGCAKVMLKCPDCGGRGEAITEWSDRAERDPELKALVTYYPNPPDGTVYIRCPRCGKEG